MTPLSLVLHTGNDVSMALPSSIANERREEKRVLISGRCNTSHALRCARSFYGSAERVEMKSELDWIFLGDSENIFEDLKENKMF